MKSTLPSGSGVQTNLPCPGIRAKMQVSRTDEGKGRKRGKGVNILNKMGRGRGERIEKSNNLLGKVTFKRNGIEGVGTMLVNKAVTKVALAAVKGHYKFDMSTNANAFMEGIFFPLLFSISFFFYSPLSSSIPLLFCT